MLQQNAIAPATLELLKAICAINELEAFALGEGTNIALRMGHRVSIDLDFFTNINFNTNSDNNVNAYSAARSQKKKKKQE